MLIKFINCTEKQHSNINKIIEFLSNYFNSIGIKNETLNISNFRITKCTQCRCCTQKKGDNPAKCVIKDDMNNLIDEIEEADAYVILADRNSLFIKNKIHEKFSERLVAYYYWPFNQVESKLRKPYPSKNSILINLNTTKYFMNHSFYTSKLYMEHTSNSIGANVLDWEAITPKEEIVEAYKDRLMQMAYKLIASANQRKAS
eukprot:TRINITY_DN18353_c0_g1_i10.p1 TRINITY_DN18353_c0_g1~~TRINITY_DN18353_c0_g1_i10.p1  ORF type:complete len:202 (+),score=8.71 TRINITY_DN18353_c0_g1_i10:162-767(+)